MKIVNDKSLVALFYFITKRQHCFLSEPCINYREDVQENRYVTTKKGKSPICDEGLSTTDWYKFIYKGDAAVIPTVCIKVKFYVLIFLYNKFRTCSNIHVNFLCVGQGQNDCGGGGGLITV